MSITSPINFVKLRPNAESPFKENFKKVAYELTIVERCDNRTEDIFNDVNTFATGLVITAPKRYHIEIIEHPALYKTGYMLSGGPRIIDPDSEDEIILPLYKFRESEDIELPFVAATFVLRETEYATINGIVIKSRVDDREEYIQRSNPTLRSKAPTKTNGTSSQSRRGGKSGNGMF
jgi:hypothetical protein